MTLLIAVSRQTARRTNRQVASCFSTLATSAEDTLIDRRPLYVAATRQHVGKTSVSLALVSGLLKKASVGFMKPVGQQCVQVHEGDIIHSMDKDAFLMQEHFGLDQRYEDTSPVLIPPGYTKNYVDGNIGMNEQREKIEQAYQRIASQSDIVLCEGTGHSAVGSIVEASNAQVASWLGARMILVANGGLGNSFDELELNRVFCQQHNVDICGVVINKVMPEKYDQTKHYLTKVFQERWGVPLLGCIPDRPFLGCPAIADLNNLFQGSKLLCGQDHSLRHYTVGNIDLATTSLDVFIERLVKNPSRTLYVCHASRTDIVLGFLHEYQQQTDRQSAMIVTGGQDYSLSQEVLDLCKSMEENGHVPPVLFTQEKTAFVMEQLHAYTPKLNTHDSHRVESTIEHYEPYIDFDRLMERASTVERA
jgi:BioD-like phosphotransacetylase family protein